MNIYIDLGELQLCIMYLTFIVLKSYCTLTYKYHADDQYLFLFQSLLNLLNEIIDGKYVCDTLRYITLYLLYISFMLRKVSFILFHSFSLQ